MALLESIIEVRESVLPGAGSGLFARDYIPKGSLIVEYKGRITSWNEVDHDEGKNGYIFYVTRNHVIDAGNYKSALARYANDARGIGRVKGVLNNAEYVEHGKKVYIQAVKDIPAGVEILVNYGKEYWDAIRHNIKADVADAATSKRKQVNPAG